jgi:hypothetical protein
VAVMSSVMSMLLLGLNSRAVSCKKGREEAKGRGRHVGVMCCDVFCFYNGRCGGAAGRSCNSGSACIGTALWLTMYTQTN